MKVVVQYFFWSLFYHLITFYKQSPVVFIVGLFMIAKNFVRVMVYPLELQMDSVKNGVAALQQYWTHKEALPAPEFLKKRFLALSRKCN